MSESITKKIIREKLPEARFARFKHEKSSEADAALAATATPTAEEMLAKWSNSRFLRSYAGVESDAVESTDTDDSDTYDAEVVIIDVQAQDTPVPESLRRRTLVVDKKKGNIVAESG